MIKVRKAFFILICFFLITISNELAYSSPILRIPLIGKHRYDEALQQTSKINSSRYNRVLQRIYEKASITYFYKSATMNMVGELLYLANELAMNGLTYLSGVVLGIIEQDEKDSIKQEMRETIDRIRNISFVKSTKYDTSLLNNEGKKIMIDAILRGQDTNVLDMRYKGLLESHPAEARKSL